MNDSIAISDLITGMLHAIDALDWPGVRAAFADTVRVDYTSLAGGAPATVSADQLMATWQGLLPGFDATQHLIGPVRCTIDGVNAEAHTHVRGYHRIADAPGGPVWMVAGHYTFALVRAENSWRIEAMTLLVFYQEGNLALPQAAAQRANTSPRDKPKGI